MLFSLALDPSLRWRYPFGGRSINSTTEIYCLLTVCTIRWQKIIRADAVMFIDAVFNADSIILTRIGGTYIYSCVKERKKQLLRAIACKHGESDDRSENSDFLLLSQKDPFGKLFSEIYFQSSSEFTFL